ncbi:MAG: peptide ABC transporter substrate-binding protein [Dehalococcoidia bacterium]|jgi:oligopeptide transport system substrate-binding protein
MKKLLAVAALLSGIALVATTGCGGGGGNSSQSTDNGTSSPSSASGPSGSTLRLTGTDPLTLDPAIATDAVSAGYIVEIFGGLVTLDKDLKVQPDIAKSWDISSDGTVYTFHLRNDVVFQQTGRQVTAADFKYSMERAADPATASTVADAYLGDIVGVKDMLNNGAKSISGIEVVDDFTLRITIDAAKPYFIDKMACPTAFVVDRTQIEADPKNWSEKPNGTGPFQVKDWKLGESLTLEANPNYHLGVPAVKTVQFLLSGGSELTMYQDDEVDVAGISATDIDRVRDPSDPLHSEYQQANEMSIGYIGFNVQKAPFDDIKVRQAFALAIDRQKIVDVVLKDMVAVATGVMPPGVPGYTSTVTPQQYDPAQAKQLLSESKYGGASGLPQITITEVGAGASAGNDVQAIVEMWRQNLGVDVQIQQTEQATFWQDLDKGQYQMFTVGWVMDYPDPEDVLDLLFYSQSHQNSSHYSNPDVDKLLLQARTEPDTTKRMALYQQAEQIIVGDMPWIPLYNPQDNVVVKPYVKNFSLPPIVMPYLRYVTIET